MRFGLATDPEFLLHESPGHVERPDRLRAVIDGLAPLKSEFEFLTKAARAAGDEEILWAHDIQVIETIKALTSSGGGSIDPDTYVNSHSDRAARLAVGAGIDLCRDVLAGVLDRAFLVARPPGHHATPTRSMGFCLYSTVAIAAKACAQSCQRVLVLDWDVHHGNGTQDCLYDDPNTCFISLHQSPFYPGTGYPDERGVGPGQGLTYNLPLPAGCGDEEYLAAYFRVVRPIIREYDPQIILVSAGYDAHKKDLLGGMKVSTEGFAKLAALVDEDAQFTAAKGRLVGFLEGGYELSSLAQSVEATLRVWTGLDKFVVEEPNCRNDQVNRLLSLAKTRFL